MISSSSSIASYNTEIRTYASRHFINDLHYLGPILLILNGQWETGFVKKLFLLLWILQFKKFIDLVPGFEFRFGSQQDSRQGQPSEIFWRCCRNWKTCNYGFNFLTASKNLRGPKLKIWMINRNKMTFIELAGTRLLAATFLWANWSDTFRCRLLTFLGLF